MKYLAIGVVLVMLASLSLYAQPQDEGEFGPGQRRGGEEWRESSEMQRGGERGEQQGRMQGFRERMGEQIGDKMTRMREHLKRQDPEAYEMTKKVKELEKEAKSLARDYAKSDSEEEKEQIKEKIENILKEALELKFEISDRRLKTVEEKVKTLRDTHEKRKEHSGEMIEQYMDKLLKAKEAEYLKW